MGGGQSEERFLFFVGMPSGRVGVQQGFERCSQCGIGCGWDRSVGIEG